MWALISMSRLRWPIGTARPQQRSERWRQPCLGSDEAKPAPLVLVVDDSLTVRRVTQRLLERGLPRVQLAKDGLA
jgi:PleD family two-component response regulator